MAPKALILDMGNVLIFHDNGKLCRVFAQRSGKKPEDIEPLLQSSTPLGGAINRGELDEEGTYREVTRALGLSMSFPEFEALWSCHFDVHHAVLPLVERLLGKVRLVLLSNTNALHVRHCRQALPMLDKFDALLFSNETGLLKPEPAFFRRAVEAAGVQAFDCLYFDDLKPYVVAARELGMRAEVFTTAEAFAAQLAAAGL